MKSYDIFNCYFYFSQCIVVISVVASTLKVIHRQQEDFIFFIFRDLKMLSEDYFAFLGIVCLFLFFYQKKYCFKKIYCRLPIKKKKKQNKIKLN